MATAAAVETSTPTRRPTQAKADPSAVIVAVTEANLLLQDAISQPSEENLANLGSLWQGRALTKVEKFAIEQNERYSKPFVASFEFISRPIVSERLSPSQVVITAQERWRYGQSANADQEALEFIYTLNWRNGQWIITRYTYRNLPP